MCTYKPFSSLRKLACVICNQYSNETLYKYCIIVIASGDKLHSESKALIVTLVILFVYDMYNTPFFFLVYGFLEDEIAEAERGTGYSFRVGYAKGTGSTLRLSIVPQSGGTASMNCSFAD